MENLTLKEKCKMYQERTNFFVDTNKYILVHVDGRSFSRMVKNKFKKPFDDVFINMMNKTAQELCKKVQGVKIAYTQSDEITLLIKKNTPDSDIFFSGRLCKMQSIIAAIATSKFNQLMTINSIAEGKTIDEDSPLYEFDCKVWTVDNANDAFAWLLFRNIDCVRNSKQQAAQTYLPHKKLLNLDADKQVELLEAEKGIKWADYDCGKKYGRYIVAENVVETTKDYKGNDVTYERHKWMVKEGVSLTTEEGRRRFEILCPCLNEKAVE